MTGMVERVARAMVAADSGPEGSQLFHIHWEEFGDGYMKGARAAIEAMRKPTDEMLAAGYATKNPGEARATFEAMIDAALSEGEANAE